MRYTFHLLSPFLFQSYFYKISLLMKIQISYKLKQIKLKDDKSYTYVYSRIIYDLQILAWVKYVLSFYLILFL